MAIAYFKGLSRRRKQRWGLGFAVGITSVGILSGVCALYKTVRRVENIFDPSAVCLQKQARYIYLPTADVDDEFEEQKLWEVGQWDKRYKFPYLEEWIERKIKGLSWRMLEIISSSETTREKIRTAKFLTSFRHLEDSDYAHLAQQSDCQTAVILAREPRVDSRFFLAAPMRREASDKTQLLMKFQELFDELKNKHSHWCLGYFTSRMFRNSILNYWLKDLEYLVFESVVCPLKITDENTIQLCLESLLHHILIENNVHSMVEAKGLEILMDACRFMKDSFEVKVLSAKIVMKVSSEPRYLRDIHITGWLKTLVEWSKDPDQRLSSPAASALSNLERTPELGSCFKSEVCLLHPLYRETSPEVDVIFVHGLLGSAHSSWVQRKSKTEFSKKAENHFFPETSSMNSYCTTSSTVLNDLILQNEENNYEKDYEFILADIPVSESQCTVDDVYTIREELNNRCIQCSCCTPKSQCWPKDWLPKDYKRLRILGVDYCSRITDWTNWCPFRFNEENSRLSKRGNVIMEQLIDCGVGERPIVWVGHSMGGLIIKHMLNQATFSNTPKHSQFLTNTKSVFFLGTPHFGSPVACIRKYLAPLLPSAETKELELNSPDLIDLHEQFTDIVEKFDIRVVSFNETKGAKLTVPPLELEINCLAPSPRDVGTGIVYDIPVGHIDIAKLGTPLSFIYVKVLEHIKQAANNRQMQ